QTLLFCKGEDERIYINKVNDFQYIRWHDLSLDVLPSVGSKALAIERVIQHVGARRENTYAFGDGLTDIKMLEYVGKGVAMGNALEEAKKAADFVTDNTANGGIVKGLQKLNLLGACHSPNFVD